MAKHVAVSTKRVAIDKSNTQLVIIVAVAAFVSVLCLIGAQQLFSQNQYLQRVISAKQKAHNQLLVNQTTAKSLIASYDAFNGSASNVLGGSSSTTGNNNGANGDIILDALPSSYDFPALASSLEKILTSNNFKVNSITGTDDELNQQSNTTSGNPQPVPMPFSFSIGDTNYQAVSGLITTLQKSIRPIVINSMTISGGGNDMQLTVNAQTYYQPAKELKITSEAVR